METRMQSTEVIHRNELAGNSKQVQCNPQNPKQRDGLAGNSKHV